MTATLPMVEAQDLAPLKKQLIDWLSIIDPPLSPTVSGWESYIEEIHSEPWLMEEHPPDSLKLSLYTAENRYLLLVRPEGEGHSLTVYCLARQPFKDEQPFNPDSFISGGDFSVDTLCGCLFSILERELIARV